jgi:hypothetical protein
MKNIIYRVKDKKGKYQQSYSASLPDSYSWAKSCAELTNGQVYEDKLNDFGLTESSIKIFPKNTDENKKD